MSEHEMILSSYHDVMSCKRCGATISGKELLEYRERKGLPRLPAGETEEQEAARMDLVKARVCELLRERGVACMARSVSEDAIVDAIKAEIDGLNAQWWAKERERKAESIHQPYLVPTVGHPKDLANIQAELDKVAVECARSLDAIRGEQSDQDFVASCGRRVISSKADLLAWCRAKAAELEADAERIDSPEEQAFSESIYAFDPELGRLYDACGESVKAIGDYLEKKLEKR